MNLVAWQVYGIISAQLVLTAIVAGTILAVPPVRGFVTTSLWFQITCAILPLVGMLKSPDLAVYQQPKKFRLCHQLLAIIAVKGNALISVLSAHGLRIGFLQTGLIPLYMYSRKHPQNLIILALWVRLPSSCVNSLRLLSWHIFMPCGVYCYMRKCTVHAWRPSSVSHWRWKHPCLHEWWSVSLWGCACYHWLPFCHVLTAAGVCCTQTASLSVGVGTACTVYEPAVVLEALCLTAAIVLGLTTYTFHAARKGYSFQRLGPILFAGDFDIVTASLVTITVSCTCIIYVLMCTALLWP